MTASPWTVEVESRRAAALSAIQSGRTPATVARHALRYAIAFGSHERLPRMLPLLAEMPADAFWRVLSGVWDTCDATWPYRQELLALMRRHALSAPARNCRELIIYRGCSRTRIRGLAWTTDPAIAARFAAGHRGLSVVDPVICRARCAAIFMRPRARCEREAVVDPAHLSDVEVFDVE